MSTYLFILVLSPFLAGLLAYFAGRIKDYFVIGFTALMLLISALLTLQVLCGSEAVYATLPEICGFGLHFKLDGFRTIYTLVATFMWAMVSLLSREYFQHHEKVNRFYLFLLWTLGATLGVFLSADLMTTFVFFEIMSFTSYVWVAQEENVPSLKAANTYLAVAVIGGLTMLMGIFMLYYRFGTLDIDALLSLPSGDSYTMAAGLCMLFGFGAKAGAFPLHIWLPKAHPVAPAPASALLSGILTKTGIYGTLILSCRLFHNNSTWGMLILILGVITMFGGALLAVFSIDLKRTLACSSMSQIGFILVGIGMQDLLEAENQLALHGSMLHMINHSLIKLVLFMVAGVVYQNIHALDLNKIRGFGRRKPLLKIFYLTGALAIGGIPLFSGYISKTLLHESIVEYGGGSLFTVIEWIFLISGGMTLTYMTKLFVAIFVESNSDAAVQKKYDEKKSYMNLTSKLALSLSSLVLFLFGLFPQTVMERVASLGEDFLGAEFTETHMVHFFSLENLKGAGISLVIAAVLYFLIIRRLLIKNGEYVNCWPKWLDLEELLYKPLLMSLLPLLFGIVCRVLDCLADTVVVLLRKTIYRDSPLPSIRTEGTALSAFLGRMCNRIQSLANLTIHRKNPVHKDYVHILALKYLSHRESNFIIQRSLSFGLWLFCIGLGLTLIYILIF